MIWNNNDTKYIIKRLILYLLISGIVFFSAQSCAKANVVSRYVCDESAALGGTNTCKTNVYNTQSHTLTFYTMSNNNWFQNYGQGYVIMTVHFRNYNGSNTGITGLQLITDYGNGGGSVFNCDIGTVNQYYDNNNSVSIYTAKCPVNIGSGGVHHANAVLESNGASAVITLGNVITFVSQESDANAITSNQSAIAQQQIQAGNTNAQAIISAINSGDGYTQQAINNAANQAHSDSQAEQQAINNNTQAINDLTDIINGNYNSNTGSDYLNVFDNLFTQQDENVIRQFIMIPFNFYILLYNAITSGSCQSITLGSLYGVNLDLPCINLRQILGATLYTIIDTIMGACLLFGIVRIIKKFFNSLFSISSTATDECGIEVFK